MANIKQIIVDNIDGDIWQDNGLIDTAKLSAIAGEQITRPQVNKVVPGLRKETAAEQLAAVGDEPTQVNEEAVEVINDTQEQAYEQSEEDLDMDALQEKINDLGVKISALQQERDELRIKRDQMYRDSISGRSPVNDILEYQRKMAAYGAEAAQKADLASQIRELLAKRG